MGRSTSFAGRYLLVTANQRKGVLSRIGFERMNDYCNQSSKEMPQKTSTRF